jgi:predicted AAA+ superfamily ATPase
LGVRRGGKTYSAIQLCADLDPVLYMNFEDPIFLDADVKCLDQLIDQFSEYYGAYPKAIIYDEIQNIEGWERWVRKFSDFKKCRLIITGSSSKLLSQELSTAVAGRVIEKIIWPLSFSEFLDFQKLNPQSDEENLIALKNYLNDGGFPQIILTQDKVEKKDLLNQYFVDLLYKDVLLRHEITARRNLEQVVHHYLANISSLHSLNALKKAYEIGIDTASKYTEALKDAFLIFEVPRYTKNLKIKSRDPKKIYSIDCGLRNHNTTSFSEDHGKLLENIVFLHLIRRFKQIYYFKDNSNQLRECDFVVFENYIPKLAIQVCDSDMEEQKLFDREVQGLCCALKELKMKEGIIISRRRREIINEKDLTIQILPAFEWLNKNCDKNIE